MYTKFLKGDLISFYGMPGIYQNLENRWFSMEPVLKIKGIYTWALLLSCAPWNPLVLSGPLGNLSTPTGNPSALCTFRESRGLALGLFSCVPTSAWRRLRTQGLPEGVMLLSEE